MCMVISNHCVSVVMTIAILATMLLPFKMLHFKVIGHAPCQHGGFFFLFLFLNLNQTSFKLRIYLRNRIQIAGCCLVWVNA